MKNLSRGGVANYQSEDRQFNSSIRETKYKVQKFGRASYASNTPHHDENTVFKNKTIYIQDSN